MFQHEICPGTEKKLTMLVIKIIKETNTNETLIQILILTHKHDDHWSCQDFDPHGAWRVRSWNQAEIPEISTTELIYSMCPSCQYLIVGDANTLQWVIKQVALNNTVALFTWTLAMLRQMNQAMNSVNCEQILVPLSYLIPLQIARLSVYWLAAALVTGWQDRSLCYNNYYTM